MCRRRTFCRGRDPARQLGPGRAVNHDRAAQLFTDALTAARKAADRFTILVSLYDLALSSQARGDLAGAAAHLQEGLALAAEAGDETSAAYYLQVLAAVAGQQDNPQRAVRLLAAAARSWNPRAADGCTPTCPAPRTTTRPCPHCAPASATPHSRRPRRGPRPPGTSKRWSTHSSKRPGHRVCGTWFCSRRRTYDVLAARLRGRWVSGRCG